MSRIENFPVMNTNTYRYGLKSAQKLNFSRRLNFQRNNYSIKQNKTILFSIGALASAAFGYISGIRKLESSYLKNVSVKKSDMWTMIPELEAITNKVNIETKKGNKIDVWDINPKNSDKYVIYCSGLGDSKWFDQNWVLKRAQRNDYGKIEFDYCGNGLSTGDFNQKGCNESLEAVVDYLKNKGIREENIGIIGHSLGAAAASDFAKNSSVRFLVLVNPFDNFKNMIKPNVSKLGLPKIVKTMIEGIPNPLIPIKNTFNNIKALQNFENPVLIITSKDDSVIPSKFAKNLYEKTKHVGEKTYKEFETGEHFFGEEKELLCWTFIDKQFSK